MSEVDFIQCNARYGRETTHFKSTGTDLWKITSQNVKTLFSKFLPTFYNTPDLWKIILTECNFLQIAWICFFQCSLLTFLLAVFSLRSSVAALHHEVLFLVHSKLTSYKSVRRMAKKCSLLVHEFTIMCNAIYQWLK